MASAVYGAKIIADRRPIPPATRSWWWVPSRKRTATACAGSTSSTRLQGQEDARSKIEFVVATNLPTAASTGPLPYGDPRVDVKGVSAAARRAGRQRHLQDGRHPPGCPGPERGGDGPSNRVKGLVKMLNPEFNPEHYEDAQFLGTCTVSQIFTSPPLRCGGQLRHLHRPAHDRRRDLGLLLGGDPAAARPVRRRCEGQHVHV